MSGGSNLGCNGPLRGPVAAANPADSQSIARIAGYHAHVYFTPDQRATAQRLRGQLAGHFRVHPGRWYDEPIGPHTRAMYQVAFGPEQFAILVPWLMLNRSGLSILLHPRTGDDSADHSIHALWLGEPLAVDLRAFGPAR